MSSTLRESIAAREAELVKRNEELDKKTLEVGKEADHILSGYDDRIRRLKTMQEEEEEVHSDDDNESNNESINSENNKEPAEPAVATTSKKKKVLKKSATKEQLGPTPEETLGPDATIRYQKSKIASLTSELSETVAELREVKLKYGKASSKLGVITDENTTLSKKLQTLAVTVEKQKTLNVSKDTKKSALEVELNSIRLELEELRKAERVAVSESRNKDLRLNRALEEVEKQRQKVKEIVNNRNGNEVARKDYEHLLKENTALEKQKNELLTAFKKQMKLIDILKRQKIHMEAAKLLNFTEEEFNKTLELNS